MKLVGGPREKGQTAEKLKPLEAKIARSLKKGDKGKSRKMPKIDIHIRMDLEGQM